MESNEEFLERERKEREEERAASPSLYDALTENLKEHGSSWNDLEAVVIAEDLTLMPPSEVVGVGDYYQGKTRIVSRDEAAEIFRKGKLLDEHATDSPDNLPFYAYTKDRIFFINFHDEFGDYWISSLPRNPNDKELPKRIGG